MRAHVEAQLNDACKLSPLYDLANHSVCISALPAWRMKLTCPTVNIHPPQSGPLAGVRSLGLDLLNASGPAKQHIMRYAMGWS